MRLGLLHSPFLHPARCWGELPAALGELGHEVVVVDADATDTPKDYARAAAEQLGAEPVRLVAHSGAGLLLPLTAARREHGWIPGAIFLDAILPGIPGETRLATLRRRRPTVAAELARALYAGGTWPDPADPAWAHVQVHPRDLTYFTEPVLVPSTGLDFPWGYLQTSAAYDGEAATAESRGRPVLRRDYGHLAALGSSAELAGDLVTLAAELDG